MTRRRKKVRLHNGVNGKTHCGGTNVATGQGFQPGNQLSKQRAYGRRFLTQHLINRLREIDPEDPKQRANGEIIMDQLVENAKRGDGRAVELILDRIEGKVPMHVTGEMSVGLSERLRNLSDEQLQEVRKKHEEIRQIVESVALVQQEDGSYTPEK